MGMLYENIMRPFLFRQDPEDAHERVISGLKVLGRFNSILRLMEHFNGTKSYSPIELFGLKFPTLVGLAAGFDKNAECWNVLPAFGFGFIEIGTVTAHEQPGNQRPRMFRIPEREALINRMGFNNNGSKAVAARLSQQLCWNKRTVPLGINIGKSKVVTVDQAIDDYLASFNDLADYADYFAINVSSPNTPDLRKLQRKGYIEDLLSILSKANEDRAKKLGVRKIPMLLKIAPDLKFTEIDVIIESLLNASFDGIIATNTMIERPESLKKYSEVGGLSGRPIHKKAVDIVNYIYRATSGKLPIIGVGGITDVKAAGDMLDAGASLIQIYTGMVYRGPFFARDVAKAVCWRQREWL